MKILVWQWGRRGAGPLFAVRLTDALRTIEGTDVFLSLSSGAEILQNGTAPRCDLPVDTYDSMAGYVWKLLQARTVVSDLVRRVGALSPDFAVCVMPGPLDLLHLAALQHLQVPVAVIVHDADRHPGDGYPLLMTLQRRFVRRAAVVIALSNHVASLLSKQGVVDRQRLHVLSLPPLTSGRSRPPRAHGGALRLLFFGRLLPYKGLNLLRGAVRQLDPAGAWVLRVVGAGPESRDLDALRATARVSVENRWVPDSEIAELLAWADVVVVPYTEASQSGVVPAAIAAGRTVVGTRVGGLVEQLENVKSARLCDPDAASLADVLRELLHEPPGPAHQQTADPQRAWLEFARQLIRHVAQPEIRDHLNPASRALQNVE
jgi:glycosyltransferase involved in cell wall biosynthesis